jgi:hypothetical protein
MLGFIMVVINISKSLIYFSSENKTISNTRWRNFMVGFMMVIIIFFFFSFFQAEIKNGKNP